MSAATHWQPEDYGGSQEESPRRLGQGNPHIGFTAYNCYVALVPRAAHFDTARLMPMFRLQSADSDQWTVIDEENLVVFKGGLRQCEDWLDMQENLQRNQARATARRHWWNRLLLACLPHRRHASAEPGRPHSLVHQNEAVTPPVSDRQGISG